MYSKMDVLSPQASSRQAEFRGHDTSSSPPIKTAVFENVLDAASKLNQRNPPCAPLLETEPFTSGYLPDSTGPLFSETNIMYQILSKGTPVDLDIFAKIDKGFFRADDDWTCYRRNYFFITCGLSLKAEESSQLYLSTPDCAYQKIEDFAVSIAGAVDGPHGKPVDLVLHTPKRDKGPQVTPGRIIVEPMEDGLSGQSQKLVNFERVQFKNATANNGKRRASQQYYIILVEAWANIGSSSEDWIRVATRTSDRIIVRGRSPGHYQGPWLSNRSLGPDAPDAYSEEDPKSIEHYYPYTIFAPIEGSPWADTGSASSLQRLGTCKGGGTPPTEQVPFGFVKSGDNSSTSSISELFSGTALSSAPSTTSTSISANNLLVDLLLEDKGMKALCLDGFKNVDPDRFERNLRRLLKHYSAALRQESTSEIEIIACKFVRNRARHTAGAIRSTVDPDSRRRAQMMENYLAQQSKGTRKVHQYLFQRQVSDIAEQSQRTQNLDQYLFQHQESDIKEEETFDEACEVIDDTTSDSSESADQNNLDQLTPPMLHLEYLKTFMQNSNAFEDLREGLMGFVIPIQVAAQKSVASLQSIRAELDDLESGTHSVQHSSDHPDGFSSLDLIHELCESLIIQCENLPTHRDRNRNLIETLVMLKREFRTILGPASYWTPDKPNKPEDIYQLQYILNKLEIIAQNVEMESTKTLQERYQWKADKKSGILENKDLPTPYNERLPSLLTSQHSFRLPEDPQLPADRVIYDNTIQFDKLQVVQSHENRLVALKSQVDRSLPLGGLETSHPCGANSTPETTISEDPAPLSTPLGPTKYTRIVSAYILSLWVRVIRLWSKISRPGVEKGFRRIEWICDCGATIYGDFDNTDEQAVNDLAKALQCSNATDANSQPPNEQTVNSSIAGNFNSSENTIICQPTLSKTKGSAAENPPQTTPSLSTLSTLSPKPTHPKYLALCVNTGGIYKTLAEIEVSAVTSDRQLFRLIKQAYHNIRGFRTRFNFLVKPTEIHFVLFNLWNIREGFVSICDKPKCIPPENANEYEYIPRPLVPLPPMPSEVFIHYMEHGDEDFCLTKNVWTQRLPRRLHKRMIECKIPTYGWGIHVVEGPNRNVVCWIVITTVFASILVSILWSSLRNDIQGGSGLGNLIMALPPVIMTAFLFKLGHV